MIRVLVADDHPIVRAGIRRSLEEAGDIEVVGEASSGEEVLKALQDMEVDVLLLDVFMPGPGFLEVLRRGRAVRPGFAALVLSVQPEEQCAVRAFRGGASGYLTKDHSAEEIVEAVRAVADGRLVFSARVAGQSAPGSAPPSPRLPHESLSDREYQVLCEIAAGRSVKEIAYQLSLSPKTVGTYRVRLMAKMKARTDADLVRYAVLEGLSA